MRAQPEDQLLPGRKGRPPGRLGLTAVAALALIAGIGYWWTRPEPAPPAAPAVVAPEPPAAAVVPPAPDIPEREPDATDASLEPQRPDASDPPATLSDEQARQRLFAELEAVDLDPAVGERLAGAEPLTAAAALVDALGRGSVARKFIDDSIDGPFAVRREGDALYMDSAGYRRFDGLVEALSAVEAQRLADSFHTVRPLFERAYEQLGLDPADFDNAVIRALDQVLATPELDEPLRLERPSVYYTYADPALESLPDLQKQLLRMGPDNVSRLKAQARALRAALLSGG